VALAVPPSTARDANLGQDDRSPHPRSGSGINVLPSSFFCPVLSPVPGTSIFGPLGGTDRDRVLYPVPVCPGLAFKNLSLSRSVPCAAFQTSHISCAPLHSRLPTRL